MTLWTLDTCGFDDTNENCQIMINDSTGELTFVRKCPAHQGITDPTLVHQENTRGKGNVEWEILQNAPTAMFDVQADGSRTFKRGITATWNWTGTAPNRVLSVHVTGISPTQNQIDSIKNKLDTRFGITNVVLTFG